MPALSIITGFRSYFYNRRREDSIPPFPAVWMLLLLLLFAGSSAFGQERYYYRGLDYGSERLFNPLNVILNGSYDIIQLQDFSRDIRHFPYASSFNNVWKNISSPVESVNLYGWKKFFRDEVLPFDLHTKNAQWWPNYQLHLIGGGMTYAALNEWYEDKGTTYPKAWASATLMFYHLLNETVENAYTKGENVDPVSDIWIFDIGGIILFNNRSVRRFFSEELNLRDWSLQPSVTFPGGHLQNNGQYFSVKWYPKKTSQYGLFYFFGINTLTGVSYKKDETDAVSFGAGLRAKKHIDVDRGLNKKTVEMVWSAGAFYDRNGSLLASVLVSGLSDYFISANVYPGIIKLGTLQPGLWVAVSRKYNVAVGFNILGFPNIGYGDFR